MARRRPRPSTGRRHRRPASREPPPLVRRHARSCAALDLDIARRASSSPCSAAAARGKSTLLRSLAGLDPATAGEVAVDGPHVGGVPGAAAAAVAPGRRQRRARRC